MAGLFSFGLLAGVAGGLVLAILAIIAAVAMRSIFKAWTLQKLATFSAVFGPILLSTLSLGSIAAVAFNFVLLTGPEAQGFVIICVATAVASITGFLLGRRLVLILFKKAHTQ